MCQYSYFWNILIFFFRNQIEKERLTYHYRHSKLAILVGLCLGGTFSALSYWVQPELFRLVPIFKPLVSFSRYVLILIYLYIQSEMYKRKISGWVINECDYKIADFQIQFSEISGGLVGGTGREQFLLRHVRRKSSGSSEIRVVLYPRTGISFRRDERYVFC
jgi:hypothetical protein